MAAAIARGWRGSGRGPELMLFTDAGLTAVHAVARRGARRGRAQRRTRGARLGAPTRSCSAVKPSAARGAWLRELGADVREADHQRSSAATQPARRQGRGLSGPPPRYLRTMPRTSASRLGRGVIVPWPSSATTQDAQLGAGPAGVLRGAGARSSSVPDAISSTRRRRLMGCSLGLLRARRRGVGRRRACATAGVDPETARRPSSPQAVAGTGRACCAGAATTALAPRSVSRSTSPGGSTAPRPGLAALERGGVRRQPSQTPRSMRLAEADAR